MKYLSFNKKIPVLLLFSALLLGINSCTDLDQKIYSVVPEGDFWQTPEQIQSGVAPGYQALTALPTGNVFNLQETTSDEQIIPTRGSDWYDGGKWQALYLHTWTSADNIFNDSWNDLYNGIGRINFALNSLENLSSKPDNVDNTIAELNVLRAYYYYLAMDLFGNVPLVTDFNTDPSTVTNSTRQEVFDFIEKTLKDNIHLLTSKKDETTYGRVNKWVGFSILAKLYLNAQVYTGQARWQDCIDACDSIINSGAYSLSPNYFDNFSVNNEGSVENIFVVPFDKVNITGNSWENFTLHYQNQINFRMSGSPYNGWCAPTAFYNLFDTSSIYTQKGGNVYRTYKDQRAGEWLVGQQFSLPYVFPPDNEVLYKAADPSLKLTDLGTGLDLVLNPNFNTIASSSGEFRLAGARNIKYFPEAGTSTNQSNDMVLFRYADILLMKAECEVRLNKNTADALQLVNQIRERAYSGDMSHDWTLGDLTLDHILDERGRELAWEMWRRQDLIRYEVASGKPYFSAARNPDKKQDPADGHLLIFPIPDQQMITNNNLKQNPGY